MLAHEALCTVPLDRRQSAQPRRSVPRGGRRTDEAVPTEPACVELVAEVARLRCKNALLENAALTFGALAERLNDRPNSSIQRD